uniref:t-SNARE coiled-coil homology domain-containing protein n=1 Tax=Lotharella oceanica TaxID=641309 RepID=A0A7S2TN44_9EUKA|mmetsp:Transcript_19145/g.36056  ORF Transcript_19145/g.36056 Transcript_19145/m.36056 type:complete len:233 (+) Transcript_19145:141-839(+)
MSSSRISPQEWMEQLERLQRRFRALQSKVRECKNQGELYGGPNVKRRYMLKNDVKKVEGKITNLDGLLSKMEDLPRKYEITAGELSRRRGLLTRLKNNVVSVSNLLARSRPPQEDTDDFNFSTQVEETLETQHLSNQQLMQRQQNEELKQDAHLDDILRGVSTLKDIGYEINNELTFQGEILDGLEQGIDKTGLSIQRNTHRVQHISVEATSCWPMFIMIFLLFVIVFLIVV